MSLDSTVFEIFDVLPGMMYPWIIGHFQVIERENENIQVENNDNQ